MTRHKRPSTQIIPRPLNTLEQQQLERWHGRNLAQIMKIDQYIAGRTAAGGNTVLSQFAKDGL